MTRPTTVLVLDDNKINALSSLTGFLTDRPGGMAGLTLQGLSDPAALDGYLNNHPEIDVVIVDAEFEKVSNQMTCLTAFRTLVRRGGPLAIGFSQDAYGRLLYPFAVCQLLPPSKHQVVVGWAYKNDKGLAEIGRLLDLIAASDRALPAPAGLRLCQPEAPITGEFMGKILKSRSDAMLWKEMSFSHFPYADLALAASIAERTAIQKIGKYFAEIKEFQLQMAVDEFHPLGAQAIFNIPEKPDRGPKKRAAADPKKEAVEAFAQAHHRFFQAPELVDIVIEHDLYPKGRRREKWWKNTRLKTVKPSGGGDGDRQEPQ
ncbi:hypothetical protein [Streptomyces prunicolor]|uniref:hypothetical protein n=1 Tax=Streptomyces prunicolor TaxID=67348 RepID=UPI003410A16F